MDEGDLVAQLRALADKLERRAPSGVASDPLGGLERASVAEEVASVLRHDLRNNLASIRNAAFYLRRRTKDTELWRSDPRMAQFFGLIDDMVLVSTGLLEDRLSLKHLFSRSVARVSGPSCVDEGVAGARISPTISVDVDAREGDVVADRAEVGLAIRCLIENAAEAAHGRVSIAARVDRDRYAIAVSDDGDGLPEAIAPRIFDAFFTTKEGRAGLGLNIARRIARRYGGDVGPHPEGLAGKGSCMVLTLPLVDASELGSGSVGPRLLLVDDDPSNLLTLATLLEGEGFAVDTAASFALAAALLARPDTGYDIVLLDQNLGDGRGTALLPMVRARLPRCAAILISGSVEADDVASAGFDAILVKATPFPEILAAVLATSASVKVTRGEAPLPLAAPGEPVAR
ncbi:MAG: hybrid sensor histidine kinase/response regulator [Byssovorax sp.]